MTEEDVVRGVNEEWIAAVNSGDVDSCMRHLTDDVTFLPPNDLAIVGKDAYKAWGREVFSQVLFLMSLKTTTMWVSGDLACLWGSARVMSSRLPEKDPTEDVIKWVHILRRQLDGSWKMALITWNSDRLFPMN